MKVCKSKLFVTTVTSQYNLQILSYNVSVHAERVENVATLVIHRWYAVHVMTCIRSHAIAVGKVRLLTSGHATETTTNINLLHNHKIYDTQPTVYVSK